MSDEPVSPVWTPTSATSSSRSFGDGPPIDRRRALVAAAAGRCAPAPARPAPGSSWSRSRAPARGRRSATGGTRAARGPAGSRRRARRPRPCSRSPTSPTDVVRATPGSAERLRRPLRRPATRAGAARRRGRHAASRQSRSAAATVRRSPSRSTSLAGHDVLGRRWPSTPTDGSRRPSGSGPGRDGFQAWVDATQTAADRTTPRPPRPATPGRRLRSTTAVRSRRHSDASWSPIATTPRAASRAPRSADVRDRGRPQRRRGRSRTDGGTSWYADRGRRRPRRLHPRSRPQAGETTSRTSWSFARERLRRAAEGPAVRPPSATPRSPSSWPPAAPTCAGSPTPSAATGTAPTTCCRPRCSSCTSPGRGSTGTAARRPTCAPSSCAPTSTSTGKPWRRERRGRPSTSAPPASELPVEERSALFEALQALPPMQRKVVVLRHWSALSVEETAHELGSARAPSRATARAAWRALREVAGRDRG